ncbi:MAG: hypothetical protein JW809_03505 [Pirellulales bacterium]|nr:hypothetical protein [Pirellulales bacterium]
MYDLNVFSITEMTNCCAVLRRLGKEAQCMEEAARRVVDHLQESLVDGPDGPRAMVLTRLFKTHPYNDLDDDLRASARGVLGGAEPSPDTPCLTLLASRGQRPEWNGREHSAGHKAIPLPSAELVRQFPMVSNLVRQFGLEINSVLQPDPSCLADLDKTTYNVFHVPEALGSPFIPAQDDFVVPLGVQSVIGFGGVFPSGCLFAIIMFSRVSVPRETADLFKPMALAVKVALLPFVGAVFCPTVCQDG